MNEVCIFAGTTEGRELTALLCGQGVDVYACVATEYGEMLLPEQPHLTVRAGRLDQTQMQELFARQRFSWVVDATHPYASAVTENIRCACKETGTEYLRLLRGESAVPENAVYVPDAQAAAAYLGTTQGNILLTTGSKELPVFASMPDFARRIYARVLPAPASLEVCREQGLPASHILAMQGPFSQEMNAAMLRAVGAEILVTKDSGSAGGFREKAEAARQTGAALVVIGRPPQVEGQSYGAVAALLAEHFGFALPRQIALVGIGPGGREERTYAAQQAIAQAECLIGAKRMLQAAAAPGQRQIEAVAPEQILQAIRAQTDCQRFAVVLSGDIGFFSGAKKLLPLLEGMDVRLIPGLSSLVCLCARLGTSYEDVEVVSLHGRQGDLSAALRRSRRVFVLVGGAEGMERLCAQLVERGLGNARVSVGERLGYEQERVTVGTAAELAGRSFDSLSVALIEQERSGVVTHGLADECFCRIQGQEGRAVPMTKREIRAVALSMLELTEDALCYDIGAGTGSVSVEMALQARRGTVYAVERRPDAVALLEENKARFHAENLRVISGEAPQALRELPAPTHVFIGGSGGDLRPILELLLEKNPAVRVVATAIALETVAQLNECRSLPGIAQAQAVCVTAARERAAGPYHLMTGQNPVYIFAFQGGSV